VKGVNVPRAGFPYVLTLIIHKGSPTVASPPPVSPAPKVMPAVTVTRRLRLYLVVDGSERASDAAGVLEGGVQYLADRLRKRTSRGAGASLSLILADESGRMTVAPTEVERFSLPVLRGRGVCALGKALSALAGQIAAPTGDGKPLVVVLLAGAPGDAWQGAAAQVQGLAAAGKANVFVIGVGGYADGGVLKALSPTPALALSSVTPQTVQQVFEWVYGIADVVLGGLEGGASGGRANVPPPPACLSMVQ
jgi:uncharacterized protein YegL